MKFEEIIGPSGGGNLISQSLVIEEILNFIEEDPRNIIFMILQKTLLVNPQHLERDSHMDGKMY